MESEQITVCFTREEYRLVWETLMRDLDRAFDGEDWRSVDELANVIERLMQAKKAVLEQFFSKLKA